MQKEMTKKLPVHPTLKAMAVGEKKAWPLIQVNAVRSSAQTLGLMFNKKWVTHVNRDEGVIEATRVS